MRRVLVGGIPVLTLLALVSSLPATAAVVQPDTTSDEQLEDGEESVGSF